MHWEVIQFMSLNTPIRHVEIERTECDEYSIDISFKFIAGDGASYLVQGIPAAPDIFEIKAHTLTKILAGSIALPRTLEFGFAEGSGRYVTFRFDTGADQAIALMCNAGGAGGAGYQNERELVFEVLDRGSLSRLLGGFKYLASTSSGKFVWQLN
jgi:hypothetical protein